MIVKNGSWIYNSNDLFDFYCTGDYLVDAVEKHKVFGWTKRFALAKNSTMYITACNSAFLKNKAVYLPINTTAYGGGPIEIDFFANPTISIISELYGIDRNQISALTPQIKYYLNSSVVSEGIQIPSDWYVFSNGNPANSSQGGGLQGTLPFIPNKGTQYMFRFKNTDSNTTANIMIAVLWLEI